MYLLVSSGPPWALAHLYHLHLMMESCHAHSTLWLSVSDNTQFVMVTEWPEVKHLVTKTQQQAKSYVSKGEQFPTEAGRALLLRACTELPLQKPGKSRTVSSLPPPLLGHRPRVAKQLAQPPSGSYSELAAPRPLGKWAGIIHPHEDWATSKSQRPALQISFGCSNSSFTLERMFRHAHGLQCYTNFSLYNSCSSSFCVPGSKVIGQCYSSNQ